MITIILPISRTDYLKPVFDCLKDLEKSKDTELLIITDGNQELQKKVSKRLDSISFSKVTVIHHSDSPLEELNTRRYRISEIHNQARNYITRDCEYVFCVEDDTTYPPYTLNKMLKTFERDATAYVEAVELGRRHTPYIGAWNADNIESPTEIASLLPGVGIEPIDAGGLYCCLVRADLYKEHKFEPYDKKGTTGLSCDVNLGLYLRNLGYNCYIDWNITCDHIGDKGSVNLGNTKPVKVMFTKDFRGWSGMRV